MLAEKRSCSNFEDVMEAVGKAGPFQRKFTYIHLLSLVTLSAMSYLNIVLVLAVPDHWCNVPGQEFTNFTTQEWKLLSIPMETGPEGTRTFSKCKMFNISVNQHPTHNWPNDSTVSPSAIDCQYGWKYDKTWYEETVPTQENWVCGKQLYVPNLLACYKFAEVFGAFVFGQLTDIVGRRPVIYLSLFNLIGGRILAIFTSSHVFIFTIAACWGSLSLCPIVHSPMVITMEISRKEDAARISMLLNISWTMGFCIIPFIQWALVGWNSFMLVTTLPCISFFFTYRYMVESPRWLASKRKFSRCLKELTKIAKANGTKVPIDAASAIRSCYNAEENRYGLLSLFSSWRLAKNTVCISTCCAITALSSFTLMLNVANLKGNPFLNFAMQSCVEVPGYIVAKISTDYFGRRLTFLGCCAISFVTYILLICFATNETLHWIVNCMVLLLKFNICLGTHALCLVSLETYPTCVRQSGMALGSISANLAGVLGPYIVIMGTAIDVRYPYIFMATFTLIAIICATMLPETINEKLPETLADARVFGKNQEYFKLPDRKTKHSVDEMALDDIDIPTSLIPNGRLSDVL